MILCTSAFAERDNIKRTVHAVVSAIHHEEFNQVQRQKLVKQTQLLKVQDAAIKRNTALLNGEKPAADAVDTIKKIAPLNITISPLNVAPQVSVHLDPFNVQIAPLNIQLTPINIHITPLTGLDTFKYKAPGAGLNRIHAMAVELYKMHLVTDTNHISIDISDKDLIVNGVKQSDEAYQHIIKKFPNNSNGNYAAPKARFQSRVAYRGVNDSLPKMPSVPQVAAMPKVPPVKQVLPMHKMPAVPQVSAMPKVDPVPQVAPMPNVPPVPQVYVNVVPKLDVNVQPKVNVHVAPVPSYKPDPIGVEIADELVKENIITDKNDVTFRITNEELIVNGVKQPEALHKKILSKYVKKPGDNINYNYSNHIK